MRVINESWFVHENTCTQILMISERDPSSWYVWLYMCIISQCLFNESCMCVICSKTRNMRFELHFELFELCHTVRKSKCDWICNHALKIILLCIFLPANREHSHNNFKGYVNARAKHSQKMFMKHSYYYHFMFP